MTSEQENEETKRSLISYVTAWGESPLPSTLTATLIAAQSLRPLQFLPLLFPPVFLFSTYLNIYEYKTDAAGINAAWSGLYLALASRRRQQFRQKWSLRGFVRGSTLGLCGANLVAGGIAYAFGERDDDPPEGEKSM